MSDIVAWMPVVLKLIEMGGDAAQGWAAVKQGMSVGEALAAINKVQAEIRPWPVRDPVGDALDAVVGEDNGELQDD